MASFNEVIIMGRLAVTPELKQTQNGNIVTAFSLAVDRRYAQSGGQKQTDFINVTAWRNTAEFVCNYFTKGQAMLIRGELQTRSWTDQNGQKHYTTDVKANEVFFCEPKRNTDGSQNNKSPLPPYTPNINIYPDLEEIRDDNDFPF